MPTIQQTAAPKFLSAFQNQPSAPAWLQSQREAARAHFERLGFPTTRHEEWKYTDVSPALEVETQPLVSDSLNGKVAQIKAHLPFETLEAHRLVFVDGHFAPELSHIGALPEGVFVGSLADKIGEGCEILPEHFGRLLDVEADVFNALNTMLAADGVVVRVPANVVLQTPVHAIFVSSAPVCSFPRNLVTLGHFAQATFYETFISLHDPRHFVVSATEAQLGEGAQLRHAKIGLLDESAFHIGAVQFHTARDAHIVSHHLNFGGALVRNNTGAVFGGENGEITLNGIVLANGNQLVDNHTTMDHAVPHCQSHENFAHVLDGRSVGVFNGKIFVRPDAQKTDAKQSNRTILLSGDATINAKPQLEIFADDVRCTHGATIGQLDQNALFYLRARGVSERDAKAILIRAFAAAALDGIENEALSQALEAEIAARLG